MRYTLKYGALCFAVALLAAGSNATLRHMAQSPQPGLWAVSHAAFSLASIPWLTDAQATADTTKKSKPAPPPKSTGEPILKRRKPDPPPPKRRPPGFASV